MDLIVSVITGATCGLISLVLIGCVMSPKVHDGVVIKTGLISMALGFGALALLMLAGRGQLALITLERALLLVNAGIAVVIVGYLIRKSGARNALRRITDWSDLDSRPHNHLTKP